MSEGEHSKKMNKFVDYYDKNYKKLLIFPILILIASFAIIFGHYAMTGEFFKKDVSLKGGVTITIFTDQQIDLVDLESYLTSNFDKGDVSVRRLTQEEAQTGLIVDAGIKGEETDELMDLIEAKLGKLSTDDYAIQEIGSSLGESFFKEAILIVLISFLLMAIVVLAYFRVIIPSLFVVWAAFNDIVSTFAVLILLDVSLSTAGIAAFLMLIGYSVDTDILLTTRVLRGKAGTIFERTLGAAKTGLTMSITSLIAVFAGFMFSQSETIKQIMLVLTIGLIFDIIHTWLTNASVLRWYAEKKQKKALKNM
ncbi:MAG: protein translocase subunit SecF [bacterium]|nr:protein translocase subunit SecF [bacterium]